MAALLLLAPAAARAGVCLVPDGSCNAYFFSVDLGEDGMRDLAGYEYGCGSLYRSASGCLHADAERYYIGITGSNGDNFEFGQIAEWNYVIDKATLTGEWNALFTYISDGMFTGHGSSGTLTAFPCSDPGLSRFIDRPDATLAP